MKSLIFIIAFLIPCISFADTQADRQRAAMHQNIDKQIALLQKKKELLNSMTDRQIMNIANAARKRAIRNWQNNRVGYSPQITVLPTGTTMNTGRVNVNPSRTGVRISGIQPFFSRVVDPNRTFTFQQ
tara:strand:- start:269 stop:652 length:384 start_codon:yes stop_codon:yes gene_type:complete